MKNKVFLLSELLRRDLAARYAGSFAGPLWAVLNPAILCALNAFVFAYVFKIRPPAGFRGGYVEFLLAGLLPWLGIQEAIMRATTSVTDQAHLVKKLRFPVALLTLSRVGAALVIQTISIALLTAFLLVAGRGSVQPLSSSPPSASSSCSSWARRSSSRRSTRSSGTSPSSSPRSS